jgi:hypothetical protein
LTGLNFTDDFYFPEHGRLAAGKTLAMRISENTDTLYGNIRHI